MDECQFFIRFIDDSDVRYIQSFGCGYKADNIAVMYLTGMRTKVNKKGLTF